MTEHDRSYSESASDTELARPIDYATICVVGLGYVGLPLAAAFDDDGHDVYGYDVDPDKIESLESGVDPTGDVGDEAIDRCDIAFSTDPDRIAEAEYVVVAVPTPVDDLAKPDLGLVETAGETVGRYLQAGATAVLESTVYPGATREVFAPAIESTADLTAGEEFGVGYSPERMVPGDDEHGLRNVVKIVSALTDETLDDVAALYETVVDAGVHRAPTVETAEAAKCVENTQRDVNIALVNELAVACDHLDLDTRAVLEAAGTKWNFHPYRPGLVGGHCIPVDPFYLIYESERNDFSPDLIKRAREVNESVPSHVAELTVRALNEAGKVLRDSRVLIAGLAYKPNVGDVRTSKIDDVVEALGEYGVTVVGFDPHVDEDLARSEFGVDVQETLSPAGFDGIVFGTTHDEFYGLNFDDIGYEMNESPVVIDVDGAFETQVADDEFVYRRL